MALSYSIPASSSARVARRHPCGRNYGPSRPTWHVYKDGLAGGCCRSGMVAFRVGEPDRVSIPHAQNGYYAAKEARVGVAAVRDSTPARSVAGRRVAGIEDGAGLGVVLLGRHQHRPVTVRL